MFVLQVYSIRTSVRAQLQLIAVHKKMFISNMIRNRMPRVMHNQSNHDGRIPSSHTGEITESKHESEYFRVDLAMDLNERI